LRSEELFPSKKNFLEDNLSKMDQEKEIKESKEFILEEKQPKRKPSSKKTFIAKKLKIFLLKYSNKQHKKN
jgi:hypothetical protein